MVFCFLLAFITASLYRCVCPALSDRKKRISKSYRTCRSTTNQSNCCAISAADTTDSPLVRDALGDEQRHPGRRGLDELRTGPGSNVHSRARPLYIPSGDGARHHYEPDSPAQRNWQPLVPVHNQPKRPTELLLPTKQLENGHANPQPKATTYLEQFWICTKRFAGEQLKVQRFLQISLFSDEKALSDLERLARREKIYCMKLQNQNSDSDSSSKTIVPGKKNKL